MNIFEKTIMKLFKRTFEKVYKRGLQDSFNFCAGSSDFTHLTF